MRESLERSKVFQVDHALSPDLGITRFISDWLARHGECPTFQFNRVAGFPRFRVVMNLLKRSTILASVGLTSENALPLGARRLLERKTAVAHAPLQATRRLSSLAELPIMRHQPRDAGP